MTVSWPRRLRLTRGTIDRSRRGAGLHRRWRCQQLRRADNCQRRQRHDDRPQGMAPGEGPVRHQRRGQRTERKEQVERIEGRARRIGPAPHHQGVAGDVAEAGTRHRARRRPSPSGPGRGAGRSRGSPPARTTCTPPTSDGRSRGLDPGRPGTNRTCNRWMSRRTPGQFRRCRCRHDHAGGRAPCRQRSTTLRGRGTQPCRPIQGRLGVPATPSR